PLVEDPVRVEEYAETQKAPDAQAGRSVAARAGLAVNAKAAIKRSPTAGAKTRRRACIRSTSTPSSKGVYEPAGWARGTFILVPCVRGPEDSMPAFVRVEMEDRLAIVTINRPDALNALNSAVLRELSMTIEHLSMAADVGSIILTGAGDRAFVAGADLKEMVRLLALGVRRFFEAGGPHGGHKAAGNQA